MNAPYGGALDDLLQTGAHVRVLRALVGLPSGYAASTRDLARRAGVAHTTAARVLQSLAARRVVDGEHAGRSDLYRLNDEHVLVGPLRTLYASEAAFGASLVAYLRSEVPRHLSDAESAYLFGSASRGEMRRGSDVDVAVVAPIAASEERESALSTLAQKVRARYGAELNVVVTPGRASPVGKRGLLERAIAEGTPLFSKRHRNG